MGTIKASGRHSRLCRSGLRRTILPPPPLHWRSRFGPSSRVADGSTCPVTSEDIGCEFCACPSSFCGDVPCCWCVAVAVTLSRDSHVPPITSSNGLGHVADGRRCHACAAIHHCCIFFFLTSELQRPCGNGLRLSPGSVSLLFFHVPWLISISTA